MQAAYLKALAAIVEIFEPLPRHIKQWIIASLEVGLLASLAKGKRGHIEGIALGQPRAPDEGRARAHQGQNEGNAHVSVSVSLQLFEQFWFEYPKKRGKQEALRVWLRLKPDSALSEKILAALREQKTWDDWEKDDGQYIPYPKTWLYQQRWTDEAMATLRARAGANNEGIGEQIGGQASGANRFTRRGQKNLEAMRRWTDESKPSSPQP